MYLSTMKVRIVASVVPCCIPSSKMVSGIYQVVTENPKTIIE